MRKAFLYLCMVMGLTLALAACKPSLPSDVLSKGKMADILFDYHLAVAMAQNENSGSREANVIAYREAVLKKHDVTQAEFDSSMVYYMRHTELLHDVYKDLADRMDQETVALGGSASGLSEFDNLSSTGDTANIWKGPKSMVFSTDAGFNSYSFKIDADSAFHKGDRFRLDFDSQFIFQDGMRDGIALIAIQFKNDSVAQSIIHVQSSQHYSMEVADRDSLGVKCIKGYLMLSPGGFNSDAGSVSTLKLMFIEKIKLIRMHAKKVVTPSGSPSSADSVKLDSASKPRPVPHGAPQPTGGAIPMPDRPIELKTR